MVISKEKIQAKVSYLFERMSQWSCKIAIGQK